MPWTREEKVFCITTYLETKSFKTVSKQMQGCPCGVMVKAVDCRIVVSSNSSRAIMFTFGQIPLGKV